MEVPRDTFSLFRTATIWYSCQLTHGFIHVKVFSVRLRTTSLDKASFYFWSGLKLALPISSCPQLPSYLMFIV